MVVFTAALCGLAIFGLVVFGSDWWASGPHSFQIGGGCPLPFPNSIQVEFEIIIVIIAS
jgi:hypothetical protein